MSTKPHDDSQSIALDARRVHDAAVAAAKDKEFAARLGKGELAKLLADIEALESGAGARGMALATKVAAGVHTAQARAAIMSFASDVRDDAHLAFPTDVALQHAFGVGVHASAGSTREVHDFGESLLAAAHAHGKDAAKVGLDHHGVHDLENMLHALEGADLAHVHATTNRHTTTTQTDSLAHVVSAEAARIRRIAHRVFKHDEAALAAFARTLPRHAITPRAHVTAPPTTTTPSGS